MDDLREEKCNESEKEYMNRSTDERKQVLEETLQALRTIRCSTTSN